MHSLDRKFLSKMTFTPEEAATLRQLGECRGRQDPGGQVKLPHLWPGQIPPPGRSQDGLTLRRRSALGKSLSRLS